MHGQGTQVVGLVGMDLQFDRLYGIVIVANDAEAALKIDLGTEIAGVFERLVGQFGLQDAIQRLDADYALVNAVAHKVPSLPEQLHTIRCHGEGVLVFAPITLIGNLQQLAFLHRFRDHGEEILTRRNVFQEDAVLEGFAFQERIADRHSAEQPPLQAVILQRLAVLDVIAVAVALVAHDDETEHIFNRVLPGVERAARNLQSLAQIGIEPPAVDFLQRDFLGMVERFYEPDVFVDLVFGHTITLLLLHLRSLCIYLFE